MVGMKEINAKGRVLLNGRPVPAKEVESVDEGEAVDLRGNIVVSGDIGDDAVVTVEMNDKGECGLTVMGKIGNHVTLICDAGIEINGAGNFLKAHAKTAFTAHDDIGDYCEIDVRNGISLQNTGKKLVAKADNAINGKNFGAESELFSRNGINAHSFAEKCSVHAGNSVITYYVVFGCNVMAGNVRKVLHWVDELPESCRVKRPTQGVLNENDLLAASEFMSDLGVTTDQMLKQSITDMTQKTEYAKPKEQPVEAERDDGRPKIKMTINRHWPPENV